MIKKIDIASGVFFIPQTIYPYYKYKWIQNMFWKKPRNTMLDILNPKKVIYINITKPAAELKRAKIMNFGMLFQFASQNEWNYWV